MTNFDFTCLSTAAMQTHLDSVGIDSTGSREELIERHRQHEKISEYS